jgi:hypothetical protein
MRSLSYATIFCAALTGSAMVAVAEEAAPDEETLLDYVLDACEADITEYCDQVEPGEGRMLYCMAAHEDKISTGCTVALYQASAILEDLTDTIVALGEACGDDLESFCADTPIGEGRLLSCLDDNSAELSATCSEVFSAVTEE